VFVLPEREGLCELGHPLPALYRDEGHLSEWFIKDLEIHANMKPFIPPRFEFLVFGLLLSGFMSCLVTLIASVLTVGFTAGLIGTWMGNWLSSWLVAFPSVLVVAPVVRRAVHRLVISAG
jgi:hypothetical protein